MKFSIKNVRSIFAKIIFGIFFVFTFLEISLRIYGVNPQEDHLLVKPKTFFQLDKILGWKLQKGKFTIYSNNLNKNSNFTANINSQGNRFNPYLKNTKSKIKIQIYGCSNTFGYSVNDKSTQAAQLQMLLNKKYESNAPIVENKGVPGYGINQMFLSLKQSLVDKDTPSVAVFNYGAFHDLRTAEAMMWNFTIWLAVDYSSSSNKSEFILPYFTHSKNRIQYNKVKLIDAKGIFRLSKYSALSMYLNTIYAEKYDRKHADYFHNQTKQTILKMMAFCKQKGIIPVLAKLNHDKGEYCFPENRKDDIHRLIKSKSYLSLDYGIIIGKKPYSSTKDMAHPNELAHAIFAKKLYNLYNETILNMISKN
jgi:hypothetical protein